MFVGLTFLVDFAGTSDQSRGPLNAVPSSTLAAVYRRTALVLLPSEREGFGLPVLEALACGTPIVASDIEPLREVGGAAVEYCASEDLDGWTNAVLQRLSERQEDPGRWALRNRSQ